MAAPTRELTVTAGTTTQTTRELGNPNGEILAYLNVTAGATLSLTLQVLATDAAGVDRVIAQAGAAITGVSGTPYWCSRRLVSVGVPLVNIQGPIPDRFKLRVSHGNANAATYTLDVWSVAS